MQGTNCKDNSTYSPEGKRSIEHGDGKMQTYLFVDHMSLFVNAS